MTLRSPSDSMTFLRFMLFVQQAHMFYYIATLNWVKKFKKKNRLEFNEKF